MREHFDIAGYCRISVDEEAGRDNVSIENQKAIIQDYVRRTFPDSTLTATARATPSSSVRAIRSCAESSWRTSMISSSSRTSPASRAATAAVLWSWRICATRGSASSPSETA